MPISSPWLAAIRPKTLLAALSPVLAGGGYAWSQGYVNLPVWIITALTAMLLQAVANLANDYFDYKHGYDVPGREGPLRIMQNGLVRPRRFIMFTGALAAVAVVLGLFLAWRGGWPILIIGAVSLAFAFLYSAGPWPLSSHALGEASAVLFFGLVAGGGAYYLQADSINLTVLWLALTPGLLSAGLMMVNNYRDMELDRQNGKTTLATLMGAARARRLYVLALALAYVVIIWAALCAPSVSPWILLALLTLPLALKLARDIYTLQGRALNRPLAQTSLLNFLVCLLMCIGLNL